MFVSQQKGEVRASPKLLCCSSETWGEGIAEAVQAHGQMDKKFAFFHEKILFVGGRDRNTMIFSTTSSSPCSCLCFKADFWVSDNPLWLRYSFFALVHLAVLPPARSTFPPWLLFLCNLGFSWEKETFGASSTMGKYKEMPKNCRNINWNGQTKLHLGGFWGKIRDFNLISGKKVAHGLGFSCAFAVQGINVGWLHPKKLPWCNVVCPLRISLSQILDFFLGKWNLGLHNPTRNNCSQLKIRQGVPRRLLELSPKRKQVVVAFLGLFRAFLGWWKGKKCDFSSSAPSAAEFEASNMTLVATFFPQRGEEKAPRKVLFLIWVSWKHQTT